MLMLILRKICLTSGHKLQPTMLRLFISIPVASLVLITLIA